MTYLLEPTSEYPQLLRIYRSIRSAGDRADDYFETRSRQRGSDAFFEAFFIKNGDAQVVGLLELGRDFLLRGDQSAHLSMIVAPEYWKADDVFVLLTSAEERLRNAGFSKVFTSASDIEQRDAFLRRQFSLDLEIVETRLDLSHLKEKRYRPLPDGFSIRSFAELGAELGTQRYQFVLETVRAVLRDTPGQSAQAESLTAAQLQKAWQGTHFNEESCFFLVDSGQVVGVHNIVSFSKGAVTAGVTGIIPTYRRRGLMRCLKEHALVWAARNGFDVFVSQNEMNNPMLQLNLQLGFSEVRRSFELSKDLASC